MRRTAKKDGYLARTGHSVLYKAERSVWLCPILHSAQIDSASSRYENHSVIAWVIVFTLQGWYTVCLLRCIFLRYELELKNTGVWKTHSDIFINQLLLYNLHTNMFLAHRGDMIYTYTDWLIDNKVRFRVLHLTVTQNCWANSSECTEILFIVKNKPR